MIDNQYHGCETLFSWLTNIVLAPIAIWKAHWTFCSLSVMEMTDDLYLSQARRRLSSKRDDLPLRNSFFEINALMPSNSSKSRDIASLTEPGRFGNPSQPTASSTLNSAWMCSLVMLFQIWMQPTCFYLPGESESLEVHYTECLLHLHTLRLLGILPRYFRLSLKSQPFWTVVNTSCGRVCGLISILFVD